MLLLLPSENPPYLADLSQKQFLMVLMNQLFEMECDTQLQVGYLAKVMLITHYKLYNWYPQKNCPDYAPSSILTKTGKIFNR